MLSHQWRPVEGWGRTRSTGAPRRLLHYQYYRKQETESPRGTWQKQGQGQLVTSTELCFPELDFLGGSGFQLIKPESVPVCISLGMDQLRVGGLKFEPQWLVVATNLAVLTPRRATAACCSTYLSVAWSVWKHLCWPSSAVGVGSTSAVQAPTGATGCLAGHACALVHWLLAPLHVFTVLPPWVWSRSDDC